MTKVKQLFLLLLIFTFSVNYGQSKLISSLDSTMTSYSINSTQAEEGDVKFTDGSNELLRITDEGNFGAIEIKSGVPATNTNKLYNDAGTLKFGSSVLGGGSGASSLNDLSDAKVLGNNYFIGYQAGLAQSTATNNNIAIGTDALKANTSGELNTALGNQTMYLNAGGNKNSAFGFATLYANTGGSQNTALGTQALGFNTIGSNNSAVGTQALGLNSTGSNNSAVGTQALYSNTTGFENTANGTFALYSNTTGRNNTANGYKALYSNTTGSGITANGHQALYSNTTGNSNTAYGQSALYLNTTGFENTANGLGALFNNTTGNGNSAIGMFALYSNTTGSSNTANGRSALYSNTTGSSNTANGITALYSNTTGSSNTAIGYQSNYYNQEGSRNTIIGHRAGYGSSVHDKSGNIFLGYNAGYGELGDDKLYIENSSSSAPLIYGDFTDGSEKVKINGDFEVSGSVALGSNVTANGTNSVAIGSYISTNNLDGSMILADNSTTTVLNSTSIDRMTMRFDKGYRLYSDAAASVGVYMNAGGNSWNITSDSTKKENFQNVDGEDLLNKISQFKLTTWNYKTQDPNKFRHYGPMAQDFYAAFGNDGIGTIGNDTTIASSDFDGINLIAIQALEKRTKDQEASIEYLNQRIMIQDERIKILEQDNEKLVSVINEMNSIKAALNRLKKEQSLGNNRLVRSDLN